MNQVEISDKNDHTLEPVRVGQSIVHEQLQGIQTPSRSLTLSF